MNAEVIKSYLVGLGFGVDDNSLAKFNHAISSATLKVTALYGSTQLAASGIVAGISKISEGFEQMGYEYRLIIPAVNKAIALRREMLKAYSAAGINIQRVVLSAVKLNFSLAKTKFAFEAIYRSVASRFFGLLTKQSDLFRQKLYQNLPQIQAALEKFINFVFKAFEATVQLGTTLWSILGRVYDFFVKLDQATDGWSTIILGVVAAWKLLSLSFLATPFGLLLTGLVAILALYDDFQVWKEGGKSFFNWGPVVPYLTAVGNALSFVLDIMVHLGDAIRFTITGIGRLLSFNLSGFWSDFGKSGEAIVGLFSRIGQAAGFVNNPNVAANLQTAPQGAPPVAPLGSSSQNNSQTNQNLRQQTNINIVGSADASATGKAAAAEQSRVNMDLVRNMKGATR